MSHNGAPNTPGRPAGKVAITRLGQPQDVVPLAIYLASDESAFATGSLFFVDGGSVMA